MGYGGYSYDTHATLVSSRASAPVREVFKSTSTHPTMSPHGLKFRESRDSDLHPNSLAIAFVLDVTGSMGEIPVHIAKKELPTFMQRVMELGVQDPQILFMAVGDATCDQSPLQVGQFESAAKEMDDCLTAVHIEKGGGGQGTESYELGAYTLARHTAIDCFEKRGKKGYAIFTGDERPYDMVNPTEVYGLFGEHVEGMPVEAAFKELQDRYHVIFLVPDTGNGKSVMPTWRHLLGDHAIQMKGHDHTCDIAAGVIALTEGVVKSLPELAEKFLQSGMDRQDVSHIVQSLTSYADSLGREGSPWPKMTAPELPATGRSGPAARRRARETT